MATEYNPPINKRDDDELISIVFDASGEWEKGAILQAKVELEKRGVPLDTQEKRYRKLVKELEAQTNEERERRLTEDYSVLEKILLVLFWPRELLFGASYLKSQGYHFKYKQRQKFILIGALLSIIIIAWGIRGGSNMEKQRLEKINKTDISEWKKNYIGDSIRALEKKRMDTIKHDSLTK